MRAVGTNLESAMRQDMNILEAMMKDNMLNDFYATSLGMEAYLQDMARMVGQLSHRYPHMNVLEIGESRLHRTHLQASSDSRPRRGHWRRYRHGFPAA